MHNLIVLQASFYTSLPPPYPYLICIHTKFTYCIVALSPARCVGPPSLSPHPRVHFEIRDVVD